MEWSKLTWNWLLATDVHALRTHSLNWFVGTSVWFTPPRCARSALRSLRRKSLNPFSLTLPEAPVISLPTTILTAWLYQVARRTAIDVVRRETRRQAREEIAHELSTMKEPRAEWTEIEPILDEAMQTLDESERTAILLRYFENKSLREVGEMLGASENAAQKRVSRAIERLHGFFAKRGVKIAASGIGVILSAKAIQAVPLGLDAAIAAAVGQAAISTALTTTAIKITAMTTLQKTAITLVVLAAIGTSVYEAKQAASLRRELKATQEGASAPGDVQRLTRERDEAARQLAALRAENERLNGNSAELMRLRGEVTRLKGEAQGTAPQSNNSETELAARNWLNRLNQLRDRVGNTPEANIPELRLLSQEDWLAAVKDPKLETEKEYRQAMSYLRNTAQNKLAGLVQPALAKYVKENNWIFPNDLSQLQPLIESTAVDAGMLAGYSIVPADSIESVKVGGDWAISQKAAVDEELDQRIVIGPNGFGTCTWKLPNPVSKSDIDLLTPAYKAFAEGNNGHDAIDPSQLQPLLTSPEQQAALQRVLQARSAKDSKQP